MVRLVDVVFGTEVLVGGLLAETMLRRAMRRKLVILRVWPVSWLWVWIPLCLYVTRLSVSQLDSPAGLAS